MALTRGIGIRKDATRGTTPIETRKALEGLLPSAGVLDGMTVSGQTDWSYSIAAGHFVTKRGGGDGSVPAANDAALLVSTNPAPGTGSRIDIIYVKHNDVDAADPTSELVAGVAQGVASGTPVAPSLPTGALELARKTVAAGDANTSAGAAISQTAPRVVVGGGTDSGWVSPAEYGAGYSAPNVTAQTRRIGNMVHHRGVWRPSSGTIPTGKSGIVGRLPSGHFDSTQARRFPAVVWRASSTPEYWARALVEISTGGNVYLYNDHPEVITGVVVDGLPPYLVD